MKTEPMFIVQKPDGYGVSYKVDGLYVPAIFDCEEKAREFVVFMKGLSGLKIRRIWFGDFIE